jgi:F-type H+-transporting ATPase subunit b
MSIDWWTLGLQTINFLVLVWLLQRFLYRPVLAVIARRQAEIAGLIGEAGAAKQAAEKLEQDLEAQRSAIAAERERALAQARASAESERKQILAKAKVDADALIADARRALEQERSEAVVAMQKTAAALGVEVAQKLLATAPAPALSSFLDGACSAIAAMPPEQRAGLLRATGAAPVRVITARKLSAADEASCRTRLEALLGNGAAIGFADDPALIAGIEIHFPSLVLRNTWRDGLAQALKGLTGT